MAIGGSSIVEERGADVITEAKGKRGHTVFSAAEVVKRTSARVK